MIGAIIGDIIGSSYEFKNTHDYNFELFPKGSSFTDDTICTVAIADAILKGIPYRDSLIEWCRKYSKLKPMFGGAFSAWFLSDNPQPYNSFGNGSAMRVSPVGWAYHDMFSVLEEAEKSAWFSHGSIEGITGAQAIALAINHMVDNKSHTTHKEIIDNILRVYYGYNYLENVPRPGEWNATCQGCVPLALHLFLTSSSFENAVRLAVSYGGDSDTMAAIVGSLAEAYYPIPASLYEQALSYLPKDMLTVVYDFEKIYNPTANYINCLSKLLN